MVEVAVEAGGVVGAAGAVDPPLPPPHPARIKVLAASAAKVSLLLFILGLPLPKITGLFLSINHPTTLARGKLASIPVLPIDLNADGSVRRLKVVGDGE
jgi:hypothetical protein